MFWNELTLVPLRTNGGPVTHFASFHRDVSEKYRGETRGEARDPAMNTQDDACLSAGRQAHRSTASTYFEELVRRDWALAQRESRRLNFVVFDLDCFALYRDVFGRQGAEQAFRRIARVIGGCFRRASDLCGRFDEDQIAAVTTSMDLEQTAKLADAVLSRVRDLAVHHPRSNVSRYVTASAGVVSLVPTHDVTIERVYESALRALRDAKDLGRNRVVSREFE
jgi:diguanylate cyclase (GGDEF) domain